MATIKDNESPGFGVLRNASDPFTIDLDGEPYILRTSTLKRQLDAKLLGKREWYFPSIKVLSFEGDTLKLLLTYKDAPRREMTVRIEPDKLHFSCSCGMPVKTLCLHTYRALERITGYLSTDYFIQYRPGGPVELGKTHKRYFKKSVNDKGEYITPKSDLGHVFHLSDNVEGLRLVDILNFPPAETSPENEQKDTTLTYIIMISRSIYRKYLPFLLPCLGVLNKAGSAIKWFHPFMTGAPNEYEPHLTDEQQNLNRICFEMWHHAEIQSGSLIDGEPEQERSPETIFSLWEKALPILQRQPFIYKYILYGKQELRARPSRARIERVSLLKGRTRLYFHLKDKGPFWQLQMKAAIGDKAIPKFDAEAPFFIMDGDRLYFLPSLRDAGVVEWFHRTGDLVTIFKEHFPAFEREYLNPLRESYWVHLV